MTIGSSLALQGPFPFIVSLRSQDEKFLVFDDPLALTVCHINVIPTETYISDWRYALFAAALQVCVLPPCI